MFDVVGLRARGEHFPLHQSQFVCVHARVDARVFRTLHMCLRLYMSVEEAGKGEWGETVRVRFLRIYFILLF